MFDNEWVMHFLGVIALILVSEVVLVLHHFIKRMMQNKGFTLAGFWIGICKLPHHPPGVEAVEIYWLSIKHGEEVDLLFFHYLPNDPKVCRYRGGGIFRPPLLSTFYYVPKGLTSESGVFTVLLVGDRLQGLYAQYDVQAEEQLVVGRDFNLTRIHLPFAARLRVALGKKPVENHEEARKIYEACQLPTKNAHQG